MLSKLETRFEDLKGLISQAKTLEKGFAKHGFELVVKTISSVKPKKRKSKKVEAPVEKVAPSKKSAAKKKASNKAEEEIEF